MPHCLLDLYNITSYYMNNSSFLVYLCSFIYIPVTNICNMHTTPEVLLLYSQHMELGLGSQQD